MLVAHREDLYSCFQATSFLRSSLQHLRRFSFHFHSATALLSQGTTLCSSNPMTLELCSWCHEPSTLPRVYQCMLEKLPEGQMWHSIHQPPKPASLGSRWPNAAMLSSRRGSLPLATCLSLCLIPLPATQSLCFKSKRRRFAEHCQRAQTQAPGGGSPATGSPQTWFQPQQQAGPQQLPRSGISKLFSREVTQKSVWNSLQKS